jgi:hypothetical protein
MKLAMVCEARPSSQRCKLINSFAAGPSAWATLSHDICQKHTKRLVFDLKRPMRSFGFSITSHSFHYGCASRMVTLGYRAFAKNSNCPFRQNSRNAVCTRAGEPPAPDGCSRVREDEGVNPYLSFASPPVRSVLNTTVL